MESKNQAIGFLRGALLITMAQILTKVLGAVHRPLAQLLIGDAGLALATPPTVTYYMLLGVSSVGLNVAISRLISERLSKKDYQGAHRIFRIATWLLLISGLVFALLFALGASWMATAQGFPEARTGFLVLAPAMFFVTLVSALRGLYQGMQKMQPSAMSQVIEQLGRVIISIGLMIALAPISIRYGAAAFNVGNTVGIILSALYLGYNYWRERSMLAWASQPETSSDSAAEPLFAMVRSVLSIAIPISLVGAALPLMQLADSVIVTNHLLMLGGAAAREQIAYLGNAGSIRDLPSVLTTALYIALVPAITESIAANDLQRTLLRARAAFRLTFLVGIPATVALIVGSQDIYSTLYTGAGYSVMAPLALSTIFLMIQQTSSGILQGMGRIWFSVQNLMLGFLVKFALTYWWTSLPILQVKGAAYATSVGFGVTALCNMWGLRRTLQVNLYTKDDLIRPVLAALLMGAAIWSISPLTHQIVHSGRIASLLVIGVGGLTYLGAILSIGGITISDFEMVYGSSHRVVERLRRYRLIRS